jgi:phage shock protein PspC (stress-responsive transcriptional regulator)
VSYRSSIFQLYEDTHVFSEEYGISPVIIVLIFVLILFMNLITLFIETVIFQECLYLCLYCFLRMINEEVI